MNDLTTSEPMLTLPASALSALHRVAAHGRPAADAAQAVRQFGFESGEGFYRALVDWLEEREASASISGVEAERFWEGLRAFFARLGWGELRFEATRPGVVSLVSDEWREAASVAGLSDQPSCHFTTGVLADVLTRIAGADLAVLEVECRARGDARCRFLLGSPAVLERVYEGVRAGRAYTEALETLG